MATAADLAVSAEVTETYRRVELAALALGGTAAQLTCLCLSEAERALGAAIACHARAQPVRRNAALMRAMACIQALQLGVDRTQPLAPALLLVYGDAWRRLAAAAARFDAGAVGALRQELAELHSAFAGA
ncbi:flagellar protein FliS [Qipengyuania thermophila]|uniref:flagellar protein FliS n=1 Tax=Qipengyuania thermophila TaxID=2509361 RepID=UPI0013EAF687|nr:flagellar protein FliS [Qipengyuania thermophila]